MTERGAEPPRSAFGIAVRLLVFLMLALVLVYVGYLAIALGPDALSLTAADWLRGDERVLEPAERRGAVLRAREGGDRLYVLTTQAEHVIPLWLGRRSGARTRRDLLHVDLWAFDAASARPAWKRRLRTYEDGGRIDVALLGADNGTLWLNLREPIGVRLGDGAIIADGAAIERANPALAGKRVDEPGFVAFGGQGLQVTLNDASQWLIDGRTLVARPRDATPAPPGIAGPSYEAAYSSSYQVRGLPIGGSRWVGVLTDAEATRLRGEVAVPDAGRAARPADDFFTRFRAPDRLAVEPLPYRLWSAHVKSVSAAPPDWPKDFPDNWGRRDQYSDYQPLPEAPVFLKAGLLGDGASGRAYWLRDPDSVVVLHYDKLGQAGRLRLARVAGPSGTVVWDAALSLANLEAVGFGDGALLLVGTEPNPAHNPQDGRSRAEHEKIVSVDSARGTVSVFDLTAESLVDEEDLAPVELERGG